MMRKDITTKMWDWDFCFFPKKLNKQSHVHTLPQPHESLLDNIAQYENENENNNEQNDDVYSNQLISFSTIGMILTSWLNRRRRRYLILILCFPLILPLLCATCPFICAAEIFSRICRRRRRRRKTGVCGEDRPSEVERGADEVGLLLHRYLEDQLLLVIGSAYDCGDDENEDGIDTEYLDTTRPLLQ